ncbi:hypothetical protein BDW42DRAFT_45327 [Aspergillus taichungensis]|uniref:SH3 domain-containing protein n=1 Tax=Aspergillus taichungensis TaxID=482145 RepID=A0A2J5I391_9EURO|nr:hypothetical protein BDW42DRAFT_45327 [Aspergillus taichungensis]
MARPKMVRADTLDLQDAEAPSAKDHTKQGSNAANTQGALAPHQEQSIRHADQDSKSEMKQGPGGASMNGDGIDMYDDEDDLDGDLGHGHDGDDGDIGDGESDDMLDDEFMDKISSSPSIDDEDIDFEFVYALHNFVATVDGQANASKGDTMVLLDDSNSYWWLVRIVKDGSIGYLPAEHIETPTERLARLNKHRNVDLSATMLGDNSEKSKNPLKKAMRRRNAKSVAFTSPTYIEASDVDWSTDEELDDDASFADEDLARDVVDDIQEEQDDDIVVEPLRTKSQRDKVSEEPEKTDEAQEADPSSPTKPRSSQDLLEPDAESTVSRSRNGTVRNTDSFFKDETVETKKISLTPNLLRDENRGGPMSPDSKESRGSLDTLDKASIYTTDKEKAKEDKKRKDKKGGMLSGLFKRKDKKPRTSEDEPEDLEKISGESSRMSPPPKTSMESISTVSSPETRSPKSVAAVQRQTNKLQKPSPEGTSPTKQDFGHAAMTHERIPEEEEPLSPDVQKPDQTIRRVASDDAQTASRSLQHVGTHGEAVLSSIDTSRSPAKNQKDEQELVDKRAYMQPQSVMSPPQKFPPSQGSEHRNQRLDSPIHTSPTVSGVSPLAPGMSSPGRSPSPVSPPLSPASDAMDRKASDATSVSLSSELPPWSDASLRSYLDEDNDIRDLFILVHDNSNVPPAGPDHPITGSLFKEESKRLKEMTSHLDTMLSDWITRKARSTASK